MKESKMYGILTLLCFGILIFGAIFELSLISLLVFATSSILFAIFFVAEEMRLELKGDEK